MESNKYDAEFRSKINKREIAPAADSWSRLEAMLDDSKMNKRKPIPWLFIAAGILAFFVIGNLFFINQGVDVNQNQVVEKSAIPTTLEPIISEPSHAIFKEEKVAEVSQESTIEMSSKKVKSKIASESTEPTIVIEKELLAVANPVSPEEKVVKSYVTNDEKLLQLLAEASASEQPSHKVKVDARSLLSQVDGELDLTFREKVVKSATKNYQNIKLAVVNRNYE